MEKVIFKLLFLTICCSSKYSTIAQKKINRENRIIYNLPPKVDSAVDLWITKRLRQFNKSNIHFVVYLSKCSFDDSLENAHSGYCIYLYSEHHKINSRSLTNDDLVYLKSKRVILTKLNEYIIPIFFEGFDNVFPNQEYSYDTLLNSWSFIDFSSLRHHGLVINFDLFNNIYFYKEED